VELAAADAGVEREDVELRVLPKPRLVERLLPAESSESPAAALGVGGLLAAGGVPVFERLLAASGIAPYGILSLPAGWRLQ